MTAVVAPAENPPLVLRMRPAIEMTEDQFFEFCHLNRDLRIERTAQGDIIVMTPAGGESSAQNADIVFLFTIGLSVAATLLFGLMPALRASRPTWLPF